MAAGDRRIVVEVATPELVARLEDKIAKLENELRQQQLRHDSLHKTVYHVIEIVGELRRKGSSR